MQGDSLGRDIRDTKRANLRLYVATFESLPAVVALQEPGMAATPTHYRTFQQDPAESHGRDPLLFVGDFNAPSRLWGYHPEEKRGRKLAELASTLGLTLHTDPVHPTRLGNSVTRDTCPDLTFTHNTQHADWLNTEETLGSDHCIINTTIRTHSTLRGGLGCGHVHLFHLWEARHCLVRRWRRQKHNKKFKARIAELTQRAAEYAAQLADSNWVDRCNTAARQMPSRKTWCLFRALIDRNQTRSENVEMDQPFQLHDLRAAMVEMKRGPAPGRDKITVKLLAKLPDSAYQTFLDYIKEICRGDTPLPIDWKTALVTLIPKAGKAINTDNLRHISLTSCVGKHMETMVRDLKGAFDIVTHEIILTNLSQTNCGHRAFQYIRQFLTDRHSYIRIQDHEHSPIQLGTTGTPQGAVLFPLLFNLAMMHLPAQLGAVADVQHALYADDISLWAAQGSLGDIEANLQQAAT
ncbi:hypothetical protein HPB47_005931 [Ixodes persulcatus]|uniref:Uncharacterized protein n=1 Tax=Ixodes persulcatus TaxID=34615 RepID=A0AC60PBK8_IXOPE|nr:hypothetical protein HPB47_005931 [Ixodes persulcatus]